MSRDEDHGGGSWAFTNCVWAPTRNHAKRSWPFWSKVLGIREGDIVIHLRGIPPNASFVGYSIASKNGFETTQKPPIPGMWSYANSFYRADLDGFTPFHQKINLTQLFAERQNELTQYVELNNKKKSKKSNVFYVRQSGKLQCLNGAYLSDADDDLLNALFGRSSFTGNSMTLTDTRSVISIETGTQISAIRTRIGQARFAQAIKYLYGNQCCFPSCYTSDPRFLVGSHIARWTDSEKLRGEMGNGLCLCLTHDKAFECGMFTLDQDFRVFVNPSDPVYASEILAEIKAHQGQQIRLSSIPPLDEALLEHWIRVGLEP
jgi:putative restriction endonuclease